MKYYLGPVIQHLMISRAAAVLALKAPCQLPGAADFSLYVQVTVAAQESVLNSQHFVVGTAYIVSIEGITMSLSSSFSCIYLPIVASRKVCNDPQI